MNWGCFLNDFGVIWGVPGSLPPRAAPGCPVCPGRRIACDLFGAPECPGPGHVGIRTKTHKLVYYYGCNYDGGYQTPPAWELYDLKKDAAELNNVYDDPSYAKTRDELKKQFAALRKTVGDDGSHYPAAEKVVQEFWDYDGADREKARKLSGEYLKRRLQELKAGQHNTRTWNGE